MATHEVRDYLRTTDHLLETATPLDSEDRAIINYLRKQVGLALDWANLGQFEEVALILTTIQPAIDEVMIRCVTPETSEEIEMIVESVRAPRTLRWPDKR